MCGERLQAQFAVFDPTNYAENVLHYAKAIEQLRAAQAQITNQVQALKKLASPSWRVVSGTVHAVDAAMANRAGVGYAVSDPGTSLLATFPGVRATRSYIADERTQSARTLSTLASGLDAAHSDGATIAPAARQIDEFKRQTAGVEGHEQALELEGSVDVFNAQELVLLRQALAAQSAVQAVYYARTVNVQAQAEENAVAVAAAMASPAVRRPPFSLRLTP
jgi:P-type conjugative transfer protein TrbJ